MNKEDIVKVKSYPLNDGIGFIEMIDYMGGDQSAVASARVSYYDETKGIKKDTILLKYLLDNRHFSPFESIVMTFRIKAPMIVVRQWHRHRTWSYNEVSRRYTSQNIEFYYPDKWRIQDTVNTQGSIELSDDEEVVMGETASKQLRLHVKKSMKIYEDLMDSGVAREMARMVLPQNLYTMYYGTVNLRNLFNFLDQRLDFHAQWEIRQYAKILLKLAEKVAPISVDYWKELNLGEEFL